MSKAVANLTQSTETITFSAQDNGETISVNITEAARGPAGADGPAGPNEVTSATTSDGTANLSLSNVTTATATVTGTLTADHIHGNLAGSVYAHVRAGENLAKGDPVYISGSHGSGSTLIAIVSKADASDPLKMPAVGVMDAAVTANANGHMVITGTISDINTATYSVNAELYVDEGGGFTATPPSAYAQPVARVERSNTNNGAVIVKVNGLSAIIPTASTLVRRDSSGVSDFNTINLGNLHTGGSPSAPYGSIGKSVLTGSSGVGISGNPDVALEAASNRLTLSSSGFALVSGTITTSQPLSLTQTWNAAGVTFTGLLVNATITNAANASKLIDIQENGATRFSVTRSGQVSIGNAVYTNSFASDGNFRVIATSCIGWVASTNPAATADTTLFRDGAANTLAQRNLGNAQEFRLYGTTNAGVTEYERLKLKYNSTTLSYQIGTEKGGTTTSARPLEFQTDGTTRMTIASAGQITTSANLRFETPSGAGSGVVTMTMGNTPSLQLTQSTGNKLVINPGDGNISRSTSANVPLPVSLQSGGGNVGIGVTSPASKLTVTGGDAEITDSASGVILKSPDGTRYRITVANGGTLTVTAV